MIFRKMVFTYKIQRFFKRVIFLLSYITDCPNPENVHMDKSTVGQTMVEGPDERDPLVFGDLKFSMPANPGFSTASDASTSILRL